MEALRFENISKHFEGVRALKDISFRIDEGDRWGIIGPNGSGKTTALNITSGVLRPSSGKIYLYGKDVTNKPLHTFVHNTLFLPLTILDNVSLAIQGARPFRHGMFRPLSSYRALFEQAEAILQQWDLWEKRELQVNDLSYGEQRCLELILGLVSDPKVILLDEPTAGLSALEKAIFTNIIKDLPTNITVVVVEHDMDTIFELTKYLIVLDHGEIIALGDKEIIKNDAKVREVYFGSKERGNTRRRT
jgi:branched-chain amino acid transport system ATP-binding protein